MGFNFDTAIDLLPDTKEELVKGRLFGDRNIRMKLDSFGKAVGFEFDSALGFVGSGPFAVVHIVYDGAEAGFCRP